MYQIIDRLQFGLQINHYINNCWQSDRMTGVYRHFLHKYVISCLWKVCCSQKSEINEKVDNVTCWEYIQQTITINNSSIWSLQGKPFNIKDIERVKKNQMTRKNTQLNKPKQLNTINNPDLVILPQPSVVMQSFSHCMYPDKISKLVI